jgi:hypothetical protein
VAGALVLAGGTLSALLAACGGGSAAAPPSSPTSDAPLSQTARDLQQYAAASRDSQFVASYTAQLAGKRTAAVGVFLQSATRYRIDVREGTTTTSLYSTARGSSVCTVATGKAPVCFLVAKPGQPIPAQFDAGVQRIFTRDLPQLAANPRAFSITEDTALPAAPGLAAARCFAIKATTTDSALAAGVDLGTYCLSMSGPPRALTFVSGTLSLTKNAGKPTAANFVLPAAARALPSTPTPTSH